MLSRDGISGLVCLAISLWLLALTVWLPPATMVPIGPAFYPRVVLSLMAFLSALLLVFDLIGMRRRQVAAATPAGGAVAAPVLSPNYRLVFLTFIEFGIYIALLPPLGFRLATFLFVFALEVTLEVPRDRTRWLLTVAVAIATSLICYYVFEDYLSVLLPRGTWSQM
jgi:putative tricarboxylic transport membrane protein